MGSTSSLPLLPGPLWPGLVATDKTKLHTYAKLNCLNENCLTKVNSFK